MKCNNFQVFETTRMAVPNVRTATKLVETSLTNDIAYKIVPEKICALLLKGHVYSFSPSHTF